MPELPEHVARNRAYWDAQALEYREPGRRNWAATEPSWGVWAIPESVAGVLPDDLGGLDTIELGCGTAYVSAWLARRGAHPVGIDNSEAQLATARELQQQFSLEFPLLHGNAERVPYPDESFDLAISEYGASLWCDPYLWIPEAARLLRPGGQLIFLVHAPLMILCWPDEDDVPPTDRLLRPYFGMHRFEWPGDPAVEFHLGHGEMIDLLGRTRLLLERLIELRPPDGSMSRYPWASLDWARQWPCEEVWKARKTGQAPGRPPETK